MLTSQLRKWAERHIKKHHEPDLTIGPPENPMMLRWHIVKTRWFSVYLHKIVQGDADRWRHDHRSHNMTWVLKGGYYEARAADDGFNKVVKNETGQRRYRWAQTPHRIITTFWQEPCLTLFIKGPDFRRWGFYTEAGWVDYEDLVKIEDKASVMKDKVK